MSFKFFLYVGSLKEKCLALTYISFSIYLYACRNLKFTRGVLCFIVVVVTYISFSFYLYVFWKFEVYQRSALFCCRCCDIQISLSFCIYIFGILKFARAVLYFVVVYQYFFQKSLPDMFFLFLIIRYCTNVNVYLHGFFSNNFFSCRHLAGEKKKILKSTVIKQHIFISYWKISCIRGTTMHLCQDFVYTQFFFMSVYSKSA